MIDARWNWVRELRDDNLCSVEHDIVDTKLNSQLGCVEGERGHKLVCEIREKYGKIRKKPREKNRNDIHIIHIIHIHYSLFIIHIHYSL